MRKSIHEGTKADVSKMQAARDKRAAIMLKAHQSRIYEECGQMIDAGINPYAAVVAMDAKLTRIVTFNHPWVNQ